MLKHKDVRVDDFDFDKVTEWVGTSGSRPSKVMLGHKINIELFIPKGVIDNVKDNQKG